MKEAEKQMKLLAVNGSPRKNWNTATLLGKVCEGAASVGAETDLVHLYDLDYKGCTSCFACKTKGMPRKGRCAMRDGLTPLLDAAWAADALVLGSPVYLGGMTGEMRSFFERLVFPALVYSDPPRSLFPRRIPTAVLYTLGATEEQSRQAGFETAMELSRMLLEMFLGKAELLCSYDTLQFSDYSKMDAERFDPEAKAARRREVFPRDCDKAFELGRRLVSAP